MEERHGEADLVAAMASFGATGIDGELDGDRGELRLDLGFPTLKQVGILGVVLDHQGDAAGRHGRRPARRHGASTPWRTVAMGLF